MTFGGFRKKKKIISKRKKEFQLIEAGYDPEVLARTPANI